MSGDISTFFFKLLISEWQIDNLSIVAVTSFSIKDPLETLNQDTNGFQAYSEFR